MPSDFNELVKSVVRIELENYIIGKSVNDRMIEIMHEVINYWQDPANIANVGNQKMTFEEMKLHIMQLDVDAIVRGDSLHNRMDKICNVVSYWARGLI